MNLIIFPASACPTSLFKHNCGFPLASFPGPAQLSVALTESWAGPGNEASFPWFILLVARLLQSAVLLISALFEH